MVAGAVVGGGLGVFAGGASLGIMKLTGTSLEEIRYFQHQMHKKRIDLEQAGYAKQSESTNPNPLLDAHHQLVGEGKLTLDAIKDSDDLPPQTDPKAKESAK